MLYEKDKLMKFHFYVRFHTGFGESLFILGNAAELGGMDRDAAVPMQFVSEDYWKIEVDINVKENDFDELKYKYIFKNKEGELISELGLTRSIDLVMFYENDVVKVYDVWNYSGEFDNVFFSSPFKNILLPKAPYRDETLNNGFTHIFKIKAPLLQKDEVICILGDDEVLTNWDTKSPVLLQKQGDWWAVSLQLQDCKFPVAYKYGVFNVQKDEFVRYENCNNRVCFERAVEKGTVIVADGFIELANDTWKGAGVSLPVFSLRTENSLGVGEFNDIRLLVDWAKLTGLKLIQLLPVNDTTATFTWKDSYPYAAISAFALHPIFLNIEKVAGKNYDAIAEGLVIKQNDLNAMSEMNYEAVLQLKLSLLQTIYDGCGTDCLKDDLYKSFVEKNEKWLKPYGAFCYLRDKYKTADASKWETNSVYKESEIKKYFTPKSAAYKRVNFYCWLQYHLHLQLGDAVDYAHANGVVIKGDIPIGVYRYGVDAWTSPELYNMALQAGAPPDDFAVNGQNWGFPTYNWKKMQEDGFAWWKQRFEQMSHYFDAFRIDHILGFFRIWSIPINAVQGIMGRFDPCLPIHKNEFGEYGIWFDADRFCKPYITDAVLYRVFGDESENVKEQFLQRGGPEIYEMLPEFDTQKKIETWFAAKEISAENEKIRIKLYDLISNVILFEQDDSDGTEFHFRIAMDCTLSFQYLPDDTKKRLWALYLDYFYKRQDHFWKKESMKKLPGLKEATNMLVCGEDLGMVPGCVFEVMQQLGILSLEIQRMPKQSDIEFFNIEDAPYLSVVTPSTHDMSTIRGWWQENRETTQHFYNRVLGQNGEAPYLCEPWINRAIVLQHLFSPAMWSIFQIQDLMGISGELRRNSPEDERINVPANPQHYWRYRMHLTLEQLLRESNFNNELRSYIKNSGR